MCDAMNESPRALVVDDNVDAAITLAVLLRASGFQVETAFDGETALETAAQFSPDVCILDINMPRMSGYDLARRLRESNRDFPPVLATVTGNSDFAHLDRAVNAGFDLHFTKPADPIDMIDQLHACLNEKQLASSF